MPSDERVGFVRVKELVAGEEHRRGLRFVFLARGTDPVTLFPGLELLWRRPEWLGPGEWTPGVTFVQTSAPHPNGTNDYQQWMLDQDTGGAIRSANRADLYMGVGDQARVVVRGAQQHLQAVVRRHRLPNQDRAGQQLAEALRRDAAQRLNLQ